MDAETSQSTSSIHAKIEQLISKVIKWTLNIENWTLKVIDFSIYSFDWMLILYIRIAMKKKKNFSLRKTIWTFGTTFDNYFLEILPVVSNPLYKNVWKKT